MVQAMSIFVNVRVTMKMN